MPVWLGAETCWRVAKNAPNRPIDNCRFASAQAIASEIWKRIHVARFFFCVCCVCCTRALPVRWSHECGNRLEFEVAQSSVTPFFCFSVASLDCPLRPARRRSERHFLTQIEPSTKSCKEWQAKARKQPRQAACSEKALTLRVVLCCNIQTACSSNNEYYRPKERKSEEKW